MKPDNNDSRLRGRKGTARRLRIWALDPTCAACQRLTDYPNGFQLDHIKALINGGADEDHNLQVLCHGCHREKTAKDLGHTVKVEVGLDGWPA